MTINRLFILSLCVITSISSCYAVTTKSTTSTIEITAGAGLLIENAIGNFNGLLIKNNGSSIEGANIIFSAGALSDGTSYTQITGTLEPGTSSVISLNGGKKYIGVGGVSAQSISVSGSDNRLEGNIALAKGISLKDASASFTCAFTRSLSQNIKLNSGTIFLEEHLAFANGKSLVGTGTLNGNGYKIILGSTDITLSNSLYVKNNTTIELLANLALQDTLTFQGTFNAISGNGNVISLSQAGGIYVASNSTLYLRNVIIDGLALHNLQCHDHSSKIYLQDVTLALSDDLIFDKGSFFARGNVNITGNGTFIFQSVVTSTIDTHATLFLDYGMTFSYAPGIERSDLLYMQDATSKLYFFDASLFTTTAGLTLTRGQLVIDGDVHFYSPSLNTDLTGFTFGDSTLASNDCTCKILSGATLHLDHGPLLYKNVSANSFQPGNVFSLLRVYSTAGLQLFQNLNLARGRLQISTNAPLQFISPSVQLDGSLDFF